MKEPLNHGEQELLVNFNGKRKVGPVELEKVMRDISYARCRSTDYAYVYAGQFRIAEVFRLPYWEYLFLQGELHEAELKDLREGCLYLLFLLLSELDENEGPALLDNKALLKLVLEALQRFGPMNEKERKMRDSILLVNHYKDDRSADLRVQFVGQPASEEARQLEETYRWVYHEFVIRYFLDKAAGFSSK